MERQPAIIAAFIVMLSATAAAEGPGATRPATAPAKTTLEQFVKTRSAAILDSIVQDEDFVPATKQAYELFAQVTLLGSEKNLDAFREAAFTYRLTSQLAQAPKTKRLETLKFLRANDTLAHTLVFLLQRRDRPANVYALFDRLREARGPLLDKYAMLTAAICVVHDVPLTRDINENATTAPDPLDLFDYYVKNEGSMLFGIRAVPAELLCYVVDSTASIEDMKWALAHYPKDENVGHHFFDIKYDYDHFRKNTPKKVTQAGYTLPHILQFGGVCVDQAFFASSIGKAIGVPTATASGSSAEVGHEWVGFLQAANGKAWWNFDVGRYEEYRGIHGTVLDPQSRGGVPDSYVSLLAELIGTKPVDRQNCVALTDAAMVCVSLETKDADLLAQWQLEVTNARPTPRKADLEGELTLLESALNLNAGYPRAWLAVGGLAQDGKLTLAQKKRWSDVLLKTCGAKYPDFALDVLTPMIKTVDDVAEQNALWNAAFNLFQKRAYLAAEFRLNQARLWLAKNDTEKAGKCYMDVIERYANAGPFVLDALAGAEKLLEGKQDKILLLYDQTWARIQRPKDMAGPFMKQSNWFQVGHAYGNKLSLAGDTRHADAVMAQLNNAVGN